ncbi:bacillithiol biosynthesis deacetylase BshB1 [Reichenbachiella carrageenanivorans]|uniref:Bacillithiol biosynthesis deacetylase BshB1 n=1 Tax=Reichenbachiella carrageenanivorans TaxID=2979869 RepID=A0ABY6D1X5_9BACT|nr:bacillithiol biosynthesis deacetylase BshB1 [Reichenbachiella carrageenanivorans]UXX77840.1 bacillithiol biosynthesis deacetylase BshB1 [Reichenbachiella carrageenanivorans]
MKLDVLVFAAHPDDAELSCGGTILSLIAQSKKVGIVDFTRGEMGTRGTPEIRDKEAAASSKILGLAVRDNLRFQDVFFKNDDAHVLEVVKKIRQYQPEVILANALADRHPDHAKAAQVVKKAIFLAGLKNLKSEWGGKAQENWYIKNLYHYIQTDFMKPDFVVDVSDHWATRMEAVRAFKSQFFDPNGESSNTLISTPEFMELIEARGRELGLSIRVKYGEGFVSDRALGVSDLTSLL